MIKLARMANKQDYGLWMGSALMLLATCNAMAQAANDTSFVRNLPKNKGVIVFVHGILGNPKDTWSDGSHYWPAMLRDDPSFDGQNIYVYRYPSPAFGKSFSVDELADNMRLVLASDGVLKYDSITFVSHSMGGVLTRAFILKYRDMVVPKIRLLYFFATPTTGTPYAVLAHLFSQNPQFGQLYPMDSDSYLATLQSNWLAAKFKLRSYCAYETLPAYGVVVVDRQSATNLCTERLDSIDADHFSIVKPSSMTSTSYRALKQAMEETVPQPVKSGRAQALAPLYVPPAPRPGTRVPRGMTLTPASGELEITFKPSHVLSLSIRARIRHDLTRFQDFLLSLGIPVPIEIPPFGTQKDTRQLGTGTPAGLPVYRGNLLLGEKVINDPYKATLLYSDYVFMKLLFDEDSPLRPAIGVSPHVNIDNLAKLQLLIFSLASYLNASFWNRSEPEDMWPLTESLWEMRKKFGSEFTDQMVRYSLQAISDNPTRDTGVDLDLYFMTMLKIGDSVVDDNVMSRWPTAVGILEKNGLSEHVATTDTK